MTDPSELIAVRHVLIPRFCQLTGHTEKAVRRKIESGRWLEGYEYHRDPDGALVVDLEGYQRWVVGERGPGSRSGPQASGSGSRGRASGAAKPSNYPQPQPT